MEIPGPAVRAATANFRVSRTCRPGGKARVLGHFAPSREPGLGIPGCTRAAQCCSHTARDLTCVLCLILITNPDAGTWQVARVGVSMPPYGTYRPDADSPGLDVRAKVQSS